MPARHTPEDPEALLPLRPIEVLLLTMLSAGDRHGYGMRQDILEHTGGKMELEAGSLYRHIRGLEEAGLLAEAGGRPPREEDERRIYCGCRKAHCGRSQTPRWPNFALAVPRQLHLRVRQPSLQA